MRSSATGGLSIMVCAVLCLSSAAEAKAVRLTPFTPWHVDWTKRTCVLERAFGTKEAMTVLRFERFAPTSNFQFSVIGKAVDFRDDTGRTTVRLGFGTPTPTNSVEAQLGTTQIGTPLVKTPLILIGNVSLKTTQEGVDPPPVTPADEAAVRTVTVAGSRKEITFVTGPMDKAFAALRTCTDDLVRTWGLDPTQQSKLFRRAEPIKPKSWLSSDDYPAGMLLNGMQALIAFRLMVDASGLPTTCEIDRSYGDAAFLKATCRALMAHARFQPALDAGGVPVASYYVSTARWLVE